MTPQPPTTVLRGLIEACDRHFQGVAMTESERSLRKQVDVARLALIEPTRCPGFTSWARPCVLALGHKGQHTTQTRTARPSTSGSGSSGELAGSQGDKSGERIEGMP